MYGSHALIPLSGLDGSDCVLHANCFSTVLQFTQTVVKMDSGVLLTLSIHV